jgi:PAS domain-containing protein
MVKSNPKKIPARRLRSRSNPAQRELLDANQRLKSILFANEIATWTWDLESNRVIADENLMRLFGISPKDTSGAPIEHYVQFIHPTTAPQSPPPSPKPSKAPTTGTRPNIASCGMTKRFRG